MQKIYHVFISSTFSDLEEERRAVRDAAAKAGYVCEGMELFPASSQKQLDFIKRVIDRCDYYVLILAGRYGSVDDEGISYTEREYEYAKSIGIPILPFLHRDLGQLKAIDIELVPERQARLTALRASLESSQMVDFWDDAAGLATSVVVALGQESTLNPGVGWVRGDQAADPKTYEQLATAQRRISELEQELVSIRNEEVSFPEEIESIDATINIKIDISEKLKLTSRATSGQPTHREISVPISWADALVAVSDLIYRGAEERTIGTVLAKKLADLSEGNPEPTLTRSANMVTPVSELRYQFEALGLVNAVDEVASLGHQVEFGRTTIHRPAQKVVIWRLSEKGRRFLSRRMARRRA